MSLDKLTFVTNTKYCTEFIELNAEIKKMQ